ncbi:MAG: DUF4139 domain-containing protein [Akkermansia sp.]
MKTAPLILLALAGLGIAQAAMPETDMKPSKIAIFKNNYGFVTLQGQLGDHATTRLNSLPVPALGTFWVQAEQGTSIKSLVSGLFDYEEALPADMKSLAAANAGCKVQVSYYLMGDDIRTVEGTLLPFPKSPILSQGNTIGQVSTSGKNAMIGDILMLKTDTGTLTIDMERLISIDYIGDITMPTRVNKRPCVELQLAQASPGKLVQATCLSQGITWHPSYHLDLGDNGKAQLTAKATISNNLIDLDGVEMELITGYPALNNEGQIDPMAMDRQMRNAPQAISRTSSTPVALCEINMSDGMSSACWSSAGSAASGTDTGNLFFYPVANFTAKAGQVVTQPLFSESLDYKHIYTWRVEDPSRFREHIVGIQQEPSTIWDCIRFTNPLDMPLTAAPIEFTQKGRISGTNDLSYTPSKTECTVRMGRAINLMTSKVCKVQGQEVISYPSRTSKTGMVRVTKNSCLVSLSINNTSDSDAEMEITQQVKGKVIHVGQGGNNHCIVRAGTEYLDLDNIITWKVTVQAGATQQLDFTYDCIR